MRIPSGSFTWLGSQRRAGQIDWKTPAMELGNFLAQAPGSIVTTHPDPAVKPFHPLDNRCGIVNNQPGPCLSNVPAGRTHLLVECMHCCMRDAPAALETRPFSKPGNPYENGRKTLLRISNSSIPRSRESSQITCWPDDRACFDGIGATPRGVRRLVHQTRPTGDFSIDRGARICARPESIGI